MARAITTLEVLSLKELLVLRKAIQEHMDEIRDNSTREDTIMYLTLGQILMRLPEPALLTPQVCTAKDVQWEE